MKKLFNIKNISTESLQTKIPISFFFSESELSDDNLQILETHNTPMTSKKKKFIATSSVATPSNPLTTSVNFALNNKNEIFKQLSKSLNSLATAINGIDKAYETGIVKYPEFKEGDQDPLNWLKEFEIACGTNRVNSHNKKLQIVASILKGIA
ncbi:11027_t:CDS:1 [Acaulospora morrowiae]|uniref:11027_t:CDS:1 n=1 Tax=Acaulospora morrowiae TaxID=94023 RepID=A0A9N9D6I6_9GLOM|nr:11027_t:CDS:1 [Acaulospora morrowiae]